MNEFTTDVTTTPTAQKCKPILWKKFLHFVTEKNRYAMLRYGKSHPGWVEVEIAAAKPLLTEKE